MRTGRGPLLLIPESPHTETGYHHPARPVPPSRQSRFLPPTDTINSHHFALKYHAAQDATLNVISKMLITLLLDTMELY